MPDAQLHVARDPALALVVRIFVGAVAERLHVGEAARDDLRLVASELFSGAVEAGAGDDVSFTIGRDGDAVALRASGVDLAGARAASETWGGRLDLIRALFPDAEVGRSVRIAVPAASAP
ncbi:MAG TPA: hypothetical protein VFQ40_03375 [Actinomycetota bacterium]|nr:hypothetical protein [Actinomycetota bacterium]